jgi:HKD family nuclease/predicted RNA-binding protein
MPRIAGESTVADLDVQILDNDAGPIGEALARSLDRSDRADISVAFARRSGLEELTALPRFQERGGRLRFLAGTGFQQTELEVLDRIDRGAPTQVRVNVSGEALESRRTFHPKVYVCRTEDRVEAIVGSANFTRGGLRTNVETAVLLSGPAQSPVLRDLTSVFERQWESPLSRTVTPALREAYRALQTARGRAFHEALLQRSVRREESRLRNAVADLLVPPKSLAQATGRTWLLITNADNYRLCVEDSTWGNPTRSKIEKMRPGDRVLFYIKSPHSAIGAVGLVSSEVFEDRRPLWKDREYPFRLRLQILLEPRVQVPFKPLVPHLAGFRDARSWGTRLQTSQLELLPSDAAYLWDTIRIASAPVRPLGSSLFAAADPLDVPEEDSD